MRWLLRGFHALYVRLGATPPFLLCLGAGHFPCSVKIKRLTK